jgi:hypothetical protein
LGRRFITFHGAEMLILPSISKDNFEAFRKYLGASLPQSYDDWLQLRAACVAKNGPDDVIEIDVVPDEFAEYIARRGQKADLQTLRQFVSNHPWRNASEST